MSERERYNNNGDKEINMKRIVEQIMLLSTIAALASITLNIVGCKPATTPSLYDPAQKYLSDPVVDSLSPSGSALAGIDTVTIYGKNFSSSPDSVLVFFVKPGVPNNTVFRGTVFSVTPTRLSVQAPALYGDTIYVQVTVHGALQYGTTAYKLINTVSEYGGFAANQAAYGVSGSADFELYAAMSSGNVDRGIFKMAPTSNTSYAGPTTGLVGWNALKFGPGGYLYAVRGNRAIYRVAPGGGTPQLWKSATSGGFVDLDFDPSHNLWIGGTGGKIFMLDPNGNFKSFPFTSSVKALRYFNGSLYIAASVTSTSPMQVLRAPIINDSLGTPEPYFDLSSDPSGGSNIYAITFSASGDMYVGTDSSDYLIVVHPGGIIGRPYSLFVTTGALNSPCRSFAWIGANLYASTLSGQLLQFVVRKEGAPYYGIE